MASILLVSIFDELCKGLRYVAASLEDAGHQVEIVIIKSYKDIWNPMPPRNDEGYYGQSFYINGDELQQILAEIKRFNPDIIGITVFSYFTGVAEWLTRHIKRQFKGMPIVWGGVDVTYNPERAIQTADIICLGEGEIPIVELVDALEKGKDITQINNLWVRKDGKILKQPMRPLIEDLDQLPLPLYDPKFSQVVRGSAIYPFEPGNQDYVFPYILNTRGCPSSCTYCYNGPMRQLFPGQKFVRTQSVDRLLKEIKALLDCYPNLPVIQFADDALGLDRHWTEEFADKYKRRYHLPFNHYIHPTMTDFESLKLLGEAGLYAVGVGVQTASRRILKTVYRRPFYKEQILEKMNWAKQLGICAVVNLMSYNPFEDESDLEATFHFMAEVPKPTGFPTIFHLWLFENFPITRMAKAQGLPLKRLDNSNTYLSDKDLALHTFYQELTRLASLDYVPLEALEKIRKDRIFFDQPELLKEMTKQGLLGQSRLINMAWISKDEVLGYLESELNTIKGSRLHQWAEKLGNLGKGLIHPGARHN